MGRANRAGQTGMRKLSLYLFLFQYFLGSFTSLISDLLGGMVFRLLLARDA